MKSISITFSTLLPDTSIILRKYLQGHLLKRNASQAVQATSYLGTLYVPGWFYSNTASDTSELGPDLADTVPEKVKQLRKELEFNFRKTVYTNPFDQRRYCPIPIVTNGDTGHDGFITVIKFTKLRIEAGVADIRKKEREHQVSAFKKINWNYVKSFHMNPPLSINEFQRSEEIEKKYQQHKTFLNSKGIKLEDYILSTYFKDISTIEKGWVIVPNNFPYNLDKEIEHLLIWIHPKKSFTESEIIKHIEKYMKENNYQDYVYFTHYKNIRSVHEINHYHIFVKKQ